MPPEPTKLTERIGRYEIVGQLAVGGMATVLLGRLVGPRGFEHPVVIKRILPHLAQLAEFVDMFVDEARIVASIRHPNVVNVHELGHDEGELFLVMEYLEGESVGGLMRRVLTRGEDLDRALAIHIVAEACAGLHAAHELADEDGNKRNLVHRDVSPQNVFITYTGAVKILDFGIAKVSGGGTKTEAGHIKGKFQYMSPEQCAQKPLDRRSDVFALGILLYELTTGRRLFKRDSELATLKAICEQPVLKPSESIPDYPPALEKIVMRALARRPADRYATAADMRRELLGAARDLVGESLPEEALGRLMTRLFAERIEEKREMLRRVRAGSDVTRVPEAEIDVSVELPVAEEKSALRSITQDVDRTTLDEPKRGGPSRATVGALLVGVALVGVASTLWVTRREPSAGLEAMHPDATPTSSALTASNAASAPSASAPAPRDVLLHVETTPPGARLFVAGEDRGATPVDARVPKGQTAVPIELRRDGFATIQQSVVPDVDQKLVLTLTPRGRPKPAASSDDVYHRFQ